LLKNSLFFVIGSIFFIFASVTENDTAVCDECCCQAVKGRLKLIEALLNKRGVQSTAEESNGS